MVNQKKAATKKAVSKTSKASKAAKKKALQRKQNIKKLFIFLFPILLIILALILYWVLDLKPVESTSTQSNNEAKSHIVNPPKPETPPKVTPPAPLVALDFGTLPKSTCTGQTILTIVAHEDDDLLFMNPDHIHAYQNGSCLRTVYLTAGDDGNQKSYWANREKGSESAYDTLDGPNTDVWMKNTVKLSDHQYLTIAEPQNNPRISLIFLRLPDGNLNSSGFRAYNFESLQSLENGKIAKIHSVDNVSDYTSQELIDTLTGLIKLYHPDEVDTQAPVNMSLEHPDHSDHLAAGRYARSAIIKYDSSNVGIPAVKYYIGYPVEDYSQNVSPQDYIAKAAMFYSYAKFDSSVCQSRYQCQSDVYNKWLSRQYQHAF